jgi:hypothetical protein
MNSQVMVGSNIRFFLPEKDNLYTHIVRTYNNNKVEEVKGNGRESYVSWLLSLFEGDVIETNKGSHMDISGVDIALQHKGKEIRFQVKSSEYGALSFIKKDPLFSSRLIVIWVDTTNVRSRKTLFLQLYPVLKSMGICLKCEVIDAIKTRQSLIEKGVYTLPLRVATNLKSQLELLVRLGLVELKGGTYALK